VLFLICMNFKEYIPSNSFVLNYPDNWVKISNCCLLLVKGNDNDGDNETGTLHDVDAIRESFSHLDQYYIRESELKSNLNIMIFCDELSRKYSKIIFYYVGHSKNAGDSFPVIKLKDYAINLYSLHKFLEWKFIFSICCSDSCNVDISRGSNKEIFKEIDDVSPYSTQQLEKMLDNRGHLCITSSKPGKGAVGFENHGGVFTMSFLHFLRKQQSWVHSFYQTKELMIKYKYDQGPNYFGYMYSTKQSFEEETRKLFSGFKLEENVKKERSDSSEKRRTIRRDSKNSLLEKKEEVGNNIF